jgi:hypothetical protein
MNPKYDAAMTWIVIIYLISVVATFIWTFFEWNTLLSVFRKRYPDEAQKGLGNIETWIPSPIGEPVGKYFISPISKIFLEARLDSELLAKRKKAKYLLGACVIVPMGGFIVLMIVLAFFQR